MIRKTDKYLKRFSRVFERGYLDNEHAIETVRRETWWLFWIVPIYSRDTIWSKPA